MDALGQEPAQSLGEKRAAKELGRVLVFVGSFTLINLPQVRGEFRLLKAAGSHVRVGRHDFAPGFQAALRFALGRLEGLLPHLAAALFVELDAQQVHAHLFHFGSFRCGDGSQEPADAVEGPVGVVAAEVVLMGPLVAHFAQLADEAAFAVAQRAGKDMVPLVPHDGQESPGRPSAGSRSSCGLWSGRTLLWASPSSGRRGLPSAPVPQRV